MFGINSDYKDEANLKLFFVMNVKITATKTKNNSCLIN